MKIILVIIFIINIFNIISGEYFFRTIPSFLYKKFNNIKEEIFPSDIRINISLSQIDGDLLYSFDKNYNQLIVTFIDAKGWAIKIQFRNKEYFVSIHKLCGCERCLYVILNFRIQIKEQITVQCNDREVEYFIYDKNKEVKDVYPILYSKNDINNGLPNEAHMWIVNQEQYEGIYDNPQQLFGCVFNVWYERKEINFTRISDNVERKCRAVCIGDICNGGKCYETYNGVPVCDCTKAFLTGTYCNDTISSINIRSLSQEYKFHSLKVSWKSSSKEILLLNNSNVQIQLHVVKAVLILNYTFINGSYEGTLLRSYIPNREYTLIIYFTKTAIDIQFFNNGSLLNISIPTNRDISKEVFTSLLLQSGDGYIGIHIKDSPREYKWSKVYIKEFEDLINVKKNASIDQKDKRSKGINVSIVIPTVICVILSIFVIIIVYFRVKKRRRRRNKKAAEQQLLLIQQQQQDENRKALEQQELLIQQQQQQLDEDRKALEQQRKDDENRKALEQQRKDDENRKAAEEYKLRIQLEQQQQQDEKRKALEEEELIIQQQQQEYDERRKEREQQRRLLIQQQQQEDDEKRKTENRYKLRIHLEQQQQDEKRKAEDRYKLRIRLEQQREEDEKVKKYVLWVAARGRDIPPHAIDAGGGCFVARALCGGELIPGSLRKGSECCMAYLGFVHKSNDYEVLVESETSKCNSVEWHFAKGRDIPQYAIIAGRDYRGKPVYIARCKVGEETVAGEYYYGYGYIPYKGNVLRIDNNIEVLCYRPQNI